MTVNWRADVLSAALRLTFQNLLQEEDAGVADASQQLWQALLRRLPLAALANALPEANVQVCSSAGRHTFFGMAEDDILLSMVLDTSNQHERQQASR